jgi:hypothetical protein
METGENTDKRGVPFPLDCAVPCLLMDREGVPPTQQTATTFPPGSGCRQEHLWIFQFIHASGIMDNLLIIAFKVSVLSKKGRESPPNGASSDNHHVFHRPLIDNLL